MKKILFLVLLASFFSGAYSKESKMLIGVKITPTVNTLFINNFSQYDITARLGVSPGFTFDYSINPYFSLKTALSYERKGSKSEWPEIDGTGDQTGFLIEKKINYDYLVLPIMVSFNTTGRVKFYGNGGAFFGYLLSQKDIFKDTSGKKIEWDWTDGTRKIDIGTALGLGFYFPLKDNLVFDLGMRSNLGLMNTIKSEPLFSSYCVQTFSFGINLCVKYKM